MNKETPTRELEAPRFDLGDNTVTYIDGHYKLNQDPPLSIIDKQNSPHERNYPTIEELDKLSERLFGIREGIKEKIIDKLK